MAIPKRQTILTDDHPVDTTLNAAQQIAYILASILEVLLALRIILSLLGANRSNGFAQFIYSITYPFVAPFFGLFGSTFSYGVARLEVETIVAMIVYGLVAWVVIRLLGVGRDY